MMDETIAAILSILNHTGGIPLAITSTSQTAPYQFWLMLAISLVGGFFAFFFMWGSFIKPRISDSLIKIRLKRMVKITGRHILLIKHTESGIFNISMIATSTVLGIIKALDNFKGAPFDLILHTPGGEVFSSLFISRMLYNYPSKIRCFVPIYAMSGGSLLALSCDEIFMSGNGCLGPIDPQLGTFWYGGSARSWDEIVKKKGSKSNDTSIGFAFMGRQYTRTIRSHVSMLIGAKMPYRKKEKMLSILTDGSIEHAFPLTFNELNRIGYPVKLMDESLRKLLEKIMISKLFEGVYFI